MSSKKLEACTASFCTLDICSIKRKIHLSILVNNCFVGPGINRGSFTTPIGVGLALVAICANWIGSDAFLRTKSTVHAVNVSEEA